MIGLGMLAWVAVVVLGSTVVWGVVSRVGRDAAPAAAPAAPAASSAATAGPRPSARPSTRPSTRPSARPSSGSSAVPSGRPASSAPASSAPPPPATVQRTWSGAAGVVVASCRGTSVSLVRAVPSADGYRVEVTDRGPRRLRVELEGREDQEGSDTRVEAECVGGEPRFSVSAED